MRRTDRGPQPLRAQSLLRADEIRAQDVGQLHDQLIDVGPELLRLAVLQRLPGVLEQPERHRLVAIDDLTVGLQRGAQAAQAVLQQLVFFRADAGGSGVPQLEQRPGRAFRDQLADLALEPDGMLSHPVAVIAGRDLLERAIEQSGQRLHRLCIAPPHQHERKIVAQRGEIPVFRRRTAGCRSLWASASTSPWGILPVR